MPLLSGRRTNQSSTNLTSSKKRKAGKVADGYLDPDSLHSVKITVDQNAYQEMITAYKIGRAHV